MLNVNDFESLWRSSAHENVKYSDMDFPACFLVLPELIDGALAQGVSTKVIISIELNENNDKGILRVIDNGKGVTDKAQRLLSWASVNSETAHNRYGHGSKKCLTIWNKDYNCKWYVRFRTCDKRKHSSSLFTYNGPFQGIHKKLEEDENDETNLMPSGLEWCVEFNKEIFGKDIQEPQQIFETIKEILRTRYAKSYFDKTDFIVQVKKGDLLIHESSKDTNWKSFQEMIEDEVTNENCFLVNSIDQDFNQIKMTYNRYYLKEDSKELEQHFPFYGKRRMLSSRLHIALIGRTIEVAPFWTFTKRETNHNDLNGHFGFINFEGDYNKAPQPATTKVSFFEGCEQYKNFIKIMKELNSKPPKEIVREIELELEKKKPKQLVDQNKQLVDQNKKSKEHKLKKLHIECKEPKVYYKIIHFEIDNYDDFDEVNIKCLQTKKSTPVKSTITIIDNLESNIGYNFSIEAKSKETIFTHEYKQIRPDKKNIPPIPQFDSINDSTHDIKIILEETENIGLPITEIKIYKNNKILNRIPFNKEIMLKDIHEEITIQLSYINECGESEKTPKTKIKKIKCERHDFDRKTIDSVLTKLDHKCAITGVSLNQKIRYDIDHKNGIPCIINEDNCQPLLVEIHSIKTHDKKLYDLLRDNKDELFKYKIERINGFLDSLSNEEKNLINFNKQNQRIEY